MNLLGNTLSSFNIIQAFLPLRNHLVSYCILDCHFVPFGRCSLRQEHELLFLLDFFFLTLISIFPFIILILTPFFPIFREIFLFDNMCLTLQNSITDVNLQFRSNFLTTFHYFTHFSLILPCCVFTSTLLTF